MRLPPPTLLLHLLLPALLAGAPPPFAAAASPPAYQRPLPQCPRDPVCGGSATIVTHGPGVVSGGTTTDGNTMSQSNDETARLSFRTCGFLTSDTPVLPASILRAALREAQSWRRATVRYSADAEKLARKLDALDMCGLHDNLELPAAAIAGNAAAANAAAAAANAAAVLESQVRRAYQFDGGFGGNRTEYLPASTAFPFGNEFFDSLTDNFWHHLYNVFGESCCSLAQFYVEHNGAKTMTPTSPASRKRGRGNSNEKQPATMPNHEAFHADLLGGTSLPWEHVRVTIDLNEYRTGGTEFVPGCFKEVASTDDRGAHSGAGEEDTGPQGRSDITIDMLRRQRAGRCGIDCAAMVEQTTKSGAAAAACNRDTVGWWRKGSVGAWTMYTPAVLHRGRALAPPPSKARHRHFTRGRIPRPPKDRFVLVLDIARQDAGVERLRRANMPSLDVAAELMVTDLELRRGWFERARSKWFLRQDVTVFNRTYFRGLSSAVVARHWDSKLRLLRQRYGFGQGVKRADIEEDEEEEEARTLPEHPAGDDTSGLALTSVLDPSLDLDRPVAFVHITKCGGESVITMLKLHCPREFIFGERFFHASASVQQEKVGLDIWDYAHTFAFVRNPFTRQVSDFLFLTRKCSEKDRCNTECRNMCKTRLIPLDQRTEASAAESERGQQPNREIERQSQRSELPRALKRENVVHEFEEWMRRLWAAYSPWFEGTVNRDQHLFGSYSFRNNQQLGVVDGVGDYYRMTSEERARTGMLPRSFYNATQTSWLTGDDGKIAVDHWFRLEDIAKDYGNWVEVKKAVPCLRRSGNVVLPVLNPGPQRHFPIADFYKSVDVLQMMQLIYEVDFENFGYDPKIPPNVPPRRPEETPEGRPSNRGPPDAGPGPGNGGGGPRRGGPLR